MIQDKSIFERKIMTVASYYWLKATSNSDDSVTETLVRYDWTGSGTSYALAYNQVIQTLTGSFAQNAIARAGSNALLGNHLAYSFTGKVEDEVIDSNDLVYLRMAIDRGYGGLTLDKAIASLGNVKLLASPAAAFLTGAMPSMLDESMLVHNQLTIKDVLTVANPFVNTTATNRPGGVFVLPGGTSYEQAITNQWSNSNIPAIAKAASGDAINFVNAIASSPISLHDTQYAEIIQKVYLAFFNRPADPEGFNYYDTLIKSSGGDVSAATSYFGASSEYLSTYAGLSTSARVDAIYINLFGRHAEAEGQDYWSKQLDGGKLTINNVAMAVLSGAQSTDAATISNRIKVADIFTAKLDNQIKLDLYSGAQANASARGLLSTVTADANTVTAAIAKIDLTLKAAGISGSVTANMGSHAFVLNDTQRLTSILIFKAGDGVNTPDTVSNFHLDKIDVSDFGFTNTQLGVTIKTGMTAQQTASSAGFFAGKGVVIADVDANTYIYIDANKNGGFDSGVDSVIKLIGSHAVATDIVF